MSDRRPLPVPLASGWSAGTHQVVWVEGPEAVAFLDGQLSADVAGSAPGEVARSFLLEPRGKLRAIVWVLRAESGAGLLCEVDRAPVVVDALRRFLFRTDARVEPGETLDTFWGRGEDDRPHWELAAEGPVITLPGTAPHRAMAGAGGPWLTAEQVAAHRIVAGEPKFGRDVGEDTIPHETGLVAEAVSFTKGCYLGQELVARIDSRGHVNRNLRRIDFPAAQVPDGAEVFLGEAEAGSLGTVAPVPDGTVALALLHRQAVPGAEVVARWPGGIARGWVESLAEPVST